MFTHNSGGPFLKVSRAECIVLGGVAVLVVVAERRFTVLSSMGAAGSHLLEHQDDVHLWVLALKQALAETNQTIVNRTYVVSMKHMLSVFV